MNDTLVRNGNTNGTTRAPSRPHASVWFTPRFDVYEDHNEYVLMGDLPGVAPEGLEVTFENGELAIHGRVEPRYGEVRSFAGEYGVGDYRRTFSIGELIEGENISAELKDGVLTVHLPKRAEAKPRKIEVRTA
jgi:HSP20 family molecular chaperone IbpA